MLISTYNAEKPLSALEKDFCGQKVCSTMTWKTQIGGSRGLPLLGSCPAQKNGLRQGTTSTVKVREQGHL